jgi:hypothetical protein
MERAFLHGVWQSCAPMLSPDTHFISVTHVRHDQQAARCELHQTCTRAPHRSYGLMRAIDLPP